MFAHADPLPMVTRNIARTCAAIVFVGGSCAMIGRALDVPRLTDLFNIGVFMMPNTGLAFMIAALALWVRTARTGWAVIIPAVFTGVIGLATLSEHLFGVDLGIDQLLMKVTWGHQGTVAPGRMGVPASTLFICASITLCLSCSDRGARMVAAVLAAICIALGSVFVIGYLFGAHAFYDIPQYTSIALNSALLFVVLGAGMMAVLPDVEPMRTLLADTAAGALTRRALPVLILVPLLIGWLRWKGEQAGFYGPLFGTTVRTIMEILLLIGLLWWMAAAVGKHERRNKEQEAALRTSEQRYRTFVKLSSEGIWRCELERPIPVTLSTNEFIDRVYQHGYMAECNDAMARMYGYEKSADLVGVRLIDLMPRSPENEAYLTAFIEAGFRLGGGESEEVGKDGHRLYFSNNLVGVVQDGHLIHAWGTQLDITARRRVEQDLRENDRRKDEFLATLAHELRNPLSPLMNSMALLPDGEPGSELAEVRGIMQRQLDHLVHLVDDLLDVSRISRGKINLRLQAVSLREVLGMAVESSTPTLEAASQVLKLDLPEEEQMLRGDAVRLAQVFANLLNNAARYTEGAGVVELSVERKGNEAVVSIKDKGIGVAKEDLSRIFDLFSQVEHRGGRIKQGLGVGLSLVKSMVEMHGGSVEAFSEGLGHGTTFCVRLPLITEVPELRSGMDKPRAVSGERNT